MNSSFVVLFRMKSFGIKLFKVANKNTNIRKAACNLNLASSGRRKPHRTHCTMFAFIDSMCPLLSKQAYIYQTNPVYSDHLLLLFVHKSLISQHKTEKWGQIPWFQIVFKELQQKYVSHAPRGSLRIYQCPFKGRSAVKPSHPFAPIVYLSGRG